MPGRDIYRQIIETVKNLQSDDPALKSVQEKMRALDEEMTGLMNPGKNGWETVDEEKKESLVEKYEDAAAAIQEYLKPADAAHPEDENKAEIRKSVETLRNFVQADLAALRAYNPEEEEKSLPTLLEDARSITLDGTNIQNLKTVGGNQSSRIPMTIDLNGKKVSGFFTVEKVYDPIKTIGDVFNGAMQKVPAENKEEARKFFENVLKSDKQFPKGERKLPDMTEEEMHGPKGRAVSFMFNCAKPGNDNSPMKTDQESILNAIAFKNNTSPERIKGVLGEKALKVLEEKILNVEVGLGARAGIPYQAKFGVRNVATSRMADLLGIPEVIARSHPMKIKMNDKVVEGVFMEKAKGVDRNHPSASDDFISGTPLEDSDPEGFRQAADLQVLDFICGNIDRHGANMFYLFDSQGNFCGVQGIDNDTSWGVLTSGKHTKNLAALNELQFVSEETARRIANLTPEQLRFTMHGLIEENCIDAAVVRLQMVQDQLKKQKDLTEEDLEVNNIEKETHPLLPLKKEDFRSDYFVNLRDKFKFSNIFTRVMSCIEQIALFRRRKGINPKKEPVTEVGNENRATRGGVLSQVNKSNSALEMLAKATKTGRTSQNYKDVEAALKEYRDFQKKLLDRMEDAGKKIQKGNTEDPEVFQKQRVSSGDLAEMREKIRKVKEAANKYLTEKIEDLGGEENASKYEKKRINSVRLVFQFAEEGLELKPEEREQLQINQRRTTEEVVRTMNRQDSDDSINVQI